ncbi:MAG: hypothetical protein DME33_14820 [Verrucomicrobia bacterium]|nr:MAG: hypothetical protein DME33_14820 [Verrucomicrobiota bacterium]
MASVVFLRAVNVGGANRCQPAQIANELAKFRTAIAQKLPFNSRSVTPGVSERGSTLNSQLIALNFCSESLVSRHFFQGSFLNK